VNRHGEPSLSKKPTAAGPGRGAATAARIEQDVERIASFSESEPQIGCSRPTFSPAWRRARDYVIEEAKASGCEVKVDAAGNVHARRRGVGWEAPLWLCGSHIDSVPTGGKFDGVVGVVVALELLRAFPEAPVELVVFAEEEGTTFGLGMLGSRAWAGTLDAGELHRVRNSDGKSYFEAGRDHGVTEERLQAERLDPRRYSGLIEVHVEQGASMWDEGKHVAVVTAINGRRQYDCSFEGTANHAGSTKMGGRRDALAGAAEAIVAIEALARGLDLESDHTVMTVGRLLVEPNALNVIPGQARFTVDFRARTSEMLERGDRALRGAITAIAGRRKLTEHFAQTEELPPIPLDSRMRERLRRSGKALGIELSEVASGALHDTAIIAPFLPSVMLFIASRDGISHNPAEESRIEDIAQAVEIVAEAVRR